MRLPAVPFLRPHRRRAPTAAARLVLPALATLAGMAALAGPAAAAEAHGIDARGMSVLWVLPFAGILLSIAVLPMAMPTFWHHNFGKVAAAWALAFALPFAAVHGPGAALDSLLHTALLEYVPFIVLLLALFTTAGGVLLRGTLVGTPATNTALLAVGTAIASAMGTTGASMLLIRPVLRANERRRHKVHTVVFFIFLVSNIGGSLTPLGDPPLFLGFLKGVSFFWPTVHLLAPMAMVAAILLALYFAIDSYYVRRESPLRHDDEPHETLSVAGWVNVGLLGLIVATVLVQGVLHLGVLHLFGQELPVELVLAQFVMLGITAASIRLTAPAIREANGFTWAAIAEVAKIFAGIFVTIIPAIAILRAGREGALAGLVALTSTADGQPLPAMYFWLAGLLSSFLDNAPTYLIFFNLAGGDPHTLMGPLAQVLGGISAGAVFMGANSYIGNAPNFMVRSIAEERGVRMPSFFGYCAWAAVFLLPLFLLVTLVFYR